MVYVYIIAGLVILTHLFWSIWISKSNRADLKKSYKYEDAQRDALGDMWKKYENENENKISEIIKPMENRNLKDFGHFTQVFITIILSIAVILMI